MSLTCLQQVVCVVLVEFGERHDKRSNGLHYTAADGQHRLFLRVIYTNCLSLKSICASLINFVKKTGGGMERVGEREVGRDEGKEREGRKGWKRTPCVSVNFP